MYKFLCGGLLGLLLFFGNARGQGGQLPAPLQIGVSMGITTITPEKLAYADSVGIDCINISLNPLVNKNRQLAFSPAAIHQMVAKVKKATQAADIHIAAFHMPFGQKMDLALISESDRQAVIAVHRQLLDLCGTLHPDIVLFHPSWYLTVNQRDAHIRQLVQSAKDLLPAVEKTGGRMVIENMTGPELQVTRKGVTYERPLLRTMEETVAIMAQMPPDVYAAVDMNHILHPEKLILALGKRLQFVHIADGDGAHERHYFPCSGKGMNDWMAIIDALYQAGYTGPFMYECHYKDLKDLVVCYNLLYNRYLNEKYIKPKYDQ